MKPRLTKIEYLITALIVGVLGVAAVISVSNARSQARDAVRLSDVRQTQAALELYFNDFNMYPTAFEDVALGQGSTRCLSENGFSTSCTPSVESVYMEVISPTPRQGIKRSTSCSGVEGAYCYRGADAEYRIQFELENNNPILGLQKGNNCATESEIVPGSCSQLLTTNPES